MRMRPMLGAVRLRLEELYRVRVPHEKLKRFFGWELLSFSCLSGVGMGIVSFHRFPDAIIVFSISCAVVGIQLLFRIFSINNWWPWKVICVPLVFLGVILGQEYLMGIVQDAASEFHFNKIQADALASGKVMEEWRREHPIHSPSRVPNPAPEADRVSQPKSVAPKVIEVAPIYPVVDFSLAAENVEPGALIDHIPRLDLRVHNKGKLEIKDVRLRVTEYVLKMNTLVKATGLSATGKYNQDIRTSTRFDQGPIIIKSIAPGRKSRTINLAEMKPFQFVKPPTSGPQPTDERYYALRFTFDDGAGGGRYCSYLVVSRQHPYILPIDQPKTTATVTVDNNFPNLFVGQKTMILDDQRKLYRDDPEREYQSGPMQLSR